MKIVLVADMPDELGKTFLQHVHDFDHSYQGCHFRLVNYLPYMTADDLVQSLRQLRPPSRHANDFKIK